MGKIKNNKVINLDMTREAMYELAELYYEYMMSHGDELTNDYLDSINSPNFNREKGDKITFPIYSFAVFIGDIEESASN